MATIGQALTAPETGWQRIDDTNVKITYIGTWTIETVTGMYGGTHRYATVASVPEIRFKFYGTKIRVLGKTNTSQGDCTITIDGSMETYSAHTDTASVLQALEYEKTGLALGIHTVVIKAVDKTYMEFDAMDIDSTGYMVAMVGQPLTAPESGWRRYDDNDSRMLYSNSWLSASNASYYNGNSKYTSTLNEKVSFKFYGSKLRIILSFWDGGSPNTTIKIDGVSYSYSENAANIYQALAFEMLGLTLAIHTIEIICGGVQISLDAIDIDSTGYLVHPLLNQVSDPTTAQVGDCIGYKYVTTTSGVAGSFSDIGKMDMDVMIPIAGSAVPSGYAYATKIAKGLWVTDRVIQHSISWDALNTAGLIEGKLFSYKAIDKSLITAVSDKTGYGNTSPQKLFDGNLANDSTNNGFYITGNATMPIYLAFILSVPKKISRMRYFTYSTAYQPQNFTIEASNDATTATNGTWTVLKTYTSYPVIAGNTWGEYAVDSTVEYKAYRLKITTTDNGSTTQFLFNEMELCEAGSIKVRSLSGGVAYADASGASSTTDKSLGAWPTNNEWDKYIANSDLGGKITKGDDNVWHWSILNSWNKETPINGLNSVGVNTYRIARGQTPIQRVGQTLSSSVATTLGFRPVFEILETDSKSTNLFY
jgi:hypothetical protein